MREDFATTRWSMVLAAGRGESHEALSALCQAYWYPLYAYVRRRVGTREDAQDLTQEFFATLIEKKRLASAEPDCGRFRSFLLTSLKNFLANAWDKSTAQKRGGGQAVLSLDYEAAEARYQREPTDRVTPEQLFERQWVLTLLDNVVRRLREQHVADGKEPQFDVLKQFITDPATSTTYAEAAGQLGISEAAAKMAAHRLRKKYRETLRAEIADTVASQNEIEDEIQRMFAVLSQ